MKRIGLMIALLGAVLWIAGCEKPKQAKPVPPVQAAPKAQPDKQPDKQPDQASAPAEGEPDGKKVAGAVGSALFKGFTGGSSDDRPEPPGEAPPYQP